MRTASASPCSCVRDIEGNATLPGARPQDARASSQPTGWRWVGVVTRVATATRAATSRRRCCGGSTRGAPTCSAVHS